jgi:hypothetical protein
MKISGTLWLVLCLVSPWASSEIFKCTDGKGNDKYQNFPCSIDSIGSKATVQVAETVIAPASGQKQPEPGMKMNDVRATWGVPQSTDVSNGAEIWYYDAPSGNVLGVRFDRTGTVQRVGEVPRSVDDTKE